MLAAVRRLFQRDVSVRAAPQAVTDWRTQGNEALAAGDLDRAAACYRQGTLPPPGDPVAWLNLGYVQIERGEHELARGSLRTAESLLPRDDPALPDVWAVMGRERQERGEWGAAAAAYRRVVERVPGHAIAWHELGQVNELQGLLHDAEHAYTRAIGLQGDYEAALRNLARLLVRLGRDKEALPLIERCLALPEIHPESVVLHATVLGDPVRWADALAVIDGRAHDEPDARMLLMRSRVLMALERPAEALASQDQVLARDPRNIDCLVESAATLAQLDRQQEALERVDHALALEPGRPGSIAAKAQWLQGQHRFREAVELLEHESSKAARQDPELAFLASFLHLLLGDYVRGWMGYEARWQLRHRGVANRKPAWGAPEWAGQSLVGRSILVYHEQGLGDSIQMLRFIPQLATQARKVWLRVQRPLWPVLGDLPPNCELLADDGSASIDFVCPFMSLPAVFGTTIDTIPSPVPYLHAPPERIAHWRERLGPRRTRWRVGVAWSGNPAQSSDHHRSMSLATLQAAVDASGVEDVEFISVQKDLRPADEATLSQWPALRHFGAELHSFGDTAALVSQVDLVISVCTSIAHLSGALGRPLAVVLSHRADWRWHLERDDSPWYPTGKLYRQETQGEWSKPLARAIADIPDLGRQA